MTCSVKVNRRLLLQMFVDTSILHETKFLTPTKLKMKKYAYFSLLVMLLVGVASCKKKDDNLIEDNGLSKDINDFVPQDILDILDSLGMPINTGGNPTNIEGTFFFSPDILKASNRSNDVIGDKYHDVTVSFLNQDNKNLSLTTKYVDNAGSQEGNGYGSFIVGEGNDFTVFAKIKTIDLQYNDSALSTMIYSGTITAQGIENLHMALVLLDDYGDPNDQYIEIGDSRVFYDQDGLSERTEELKSANKVLQKPQRESRYQSILNNSLASD